MGTFKVEIGVSDGNGGRTERIEALVDTGAAFSVLPGTVLQRLGIHPDDEEVFTYGDGRTEKLSIGQACITVGGKRSVSPVVFGKENRYLLGATTLQTLRLVADTSSHRLIPTPELTI